MNFLRSFQSSVQAYIYPVSEPINNHGETTTVDTGLTRERGSSATTVDELVVLPSVLQDNNNRVLRRRRDADAPPKNYIIELYHGTISPLPRSMPPPPSVQCLDIHFRDS